ncbi:MULTISPECIES: hypothetical protein [Streptococcus]|uniref:hypothetical protein n=1 Tax=Streptococcus TaxID=1301 RepID=UPI0002BA7C9A|nr:MULTISPECIES: hypothetical protein [Streptococcus]EPT45468.1 hypothetical protein SAG0029_10680 [Streptococcus agalactiae FSL S3-501]MCB2830826.1 hypothetical protein [Streptococcus dysgalactiae subsp. dysgalactiae]MCB2836707.1 hypothetical protein [Streptococcus dysgalactiae subsp. dysgalactiae]MCB2838589.1 hypothetical protein [Streptococcus dysgalactiae subsp. dysgalactiae]
MQSDAQLDDLMSESLYMRRLVYRLGTLTESPQTDEEKWFHAFLERYWLLTMAERYHLFCFSCFYMREEE